MEATTPTDHATTDTDPATNLVDLLPTAFRLGQHVLLNMRVHRIVNMRAIGTGRLVELHGHAPIYVRADETLRIFTGDPPPSQP